MHLICDPSHITGNRSLIEEVSQRALDMGFDGLMIETHPDPDHALSDAAQQVTPDALKAILKRLIVRCESTEDMKTSMELEHFRQVMDSIDGDIIDLIARRMEISEQIGNIKKASNMTAYQPDRWREIVETRGEQADKMKLSREFIVALYEKIHHESIRMQLEILQGVGKQVKD